MTQDNAAAHPDDRQRLDRPPHIRWMIRRDMPEVLEIDRLSYPSTPWSEGDFQHVLKLRNAIAIIAESHDLVLGYSIYVLSPKTLEIVRLAVHPNWRRAYVGTSIMHKLESKLTMFNRPRMMIGLEASNIVGNDFVRRFGLKCTKIGGAQNNRTYMLMEKTKEQV